MTLICIVPGSVTVMYSHRMRTIWIHREAAYDWTEKWGQAENGGQVFRVDGKLQERNRMWEYGFSKLTSKKGHLLLLLL